MNRESATLIIASAMLGFVSGGLCVFIAALLMDAAATERCADEVKSALEQRAPVGSET